MQLLNDFFLSGINSAHFIKIVIFGFIAWSMWRGLRAGENGVTRGFLLVLVALIIEEIWSIWVVGRSQARTTQPAIGVTSTRFFSLYFTITAACYLSYLAIQTRIERGKAEPKKQDADE